ncbi:MAG: hypothetical protein H0W76_12630 [Pyrinomonadaceae bacterium]|nr:hypothetical protein [Pyrinomonadaceae bacterium]
MSLAVALVAASLSVSCDTSSGGGGQPSPPPPHPQNLVATLEDEVRDAGGDQVSWATYWKLCWDGYPGAVGYQLQAVTSEGTSPRVQPHQEGRCFRLEVAKNTNRRELGLHKRDVMLALASGQLAYRVRAVLAGGRTSEWSPAAGVGETTATVR